MTFCGVLSLSQVTSITLVCIGPVSVGPIGLGPTQEEHRSGPVGPSFQFRQSVPVRSESKTQSVRFGRSKLVNLGPTGLDQDRTETEVEHPWLYFNIISTPKCLLKYSRFHTSVQLCSSQTCAFAASITNFNSTGRPISTNASVNARYPLSLPVTTSTISPPCGNSIGCHPSEMN